MSVSARTKVAPVEARVAAGNLSGEHRPVEGHQAALVRAEGQQRRQVAVSDDRLARGTHQVRIEQRQQLHATVSAPRAHDPGDRPGPPAHAESAVARTCGVPASYRVHVEDRLVVHRARTPGPAVRETRLELLDGKRARRRHDRDAIARPQRAWPCPASREPPHVARHRLVLEAAHEVAQRARIVRTAAARQAGSAASRVDGARSPPRPATAGRRSCSTAWMMASSASTCRSTSVPQLSSPSHPAARACTAISPIG